MDGFTFLGYESTEVILNSFRKFFGVKRVALYRVAPEKLYRRGKDAITIKVIAKRRVWNFIVSDAGGGYSEATLN